MTLRGLNLAVGTFAILAACSAHETAGPVTPSVWSVSLTAPVSTIQATSTLVIKAQALDRNGIPLDRRSFVWNSENTAVATVDQNGMVLGVSPGSAIITASSEGIGGAFTLVVTPAPFPALTVIITSGPVLVGTSIQARAVAVNPATGNLFDAPAKWQSSAPAVVRIDSTGLLGSLAVGTARIDATFGGVTASSEITVLPRPPIRFKSVFAHHFHTCGLSVEGTAYCWGSNASSDLGAGASPAVDRSCSTEIGPCSSTPLAVGGGHILSSMADGWYFHTCADDSNGTYCWGNNRTRQLGDGTSGLIKALPNRVVSSLKYASVGTGGDVTCGLRATQSVDCWGSNEFGQLGDSTPAQTCPTSTFNDVPVQCSPTPRPVSASVAFSKLSVGGLHACALTPDGAAYCWGSADYGALGAVATSVCGKVACNKTPRPVATDLRFTDIGAGFGFTCAISTDSHTYCWGENDQGQLGIGSLSPQEISPVPVKSTSTFVKLSVGAVDVCALDSTGNAYCWGNNERGQVGDGSTTNRSTPVQIGQNLRFTSLGVGTYHVCGIATDGYAYCWGNNSMGQVGVGNEVTIMPPTRVSGQ